MGRLGSRRSAMRLQHALLKASSPSIFEALPTILRGKPNMPFLGFLLVVDQLRSGILLTSLRTGRDHLMR